MLENTDWHGGLRDRQLPIDSQQRNTIAHEIETTMKAIKTDVFPFHGL